jgi:uncharacterized protein (TIRG00374 family)
MKKHIVNLLKIAVTFGILYLIFKRFQIGWGDIRTALTESNPWWFLGSIATQMVAITFSILRWNVLLKAQDLILPTRHIINTYLVGRFLGTFTPTGVGLEAYKAYDVARYTGRATESVAVIIIEKIIATFFSLSILVLISLPFVKLAPAFLGAFFAFFFFLLLVALVLLFKPSFIEKILSFNFPMKAKVEGKLREAINAFTIYSQRKSALLKAIVFGFFVYIALFTTYYTNSLALHAGVGLLDVLKIGPLTQIATMIPLSIAGIGLREGAFIGLLNTAGVEFISSATVLTATMWYFVSISVNIVGAIIFLTRKTDYKNIQAEQVQTLMRDGKIES